MVKMKKIILSFLLSLTLICNSSMVAFASPSSDIITDIYLSSEKMNNVLRFALEQIGVVLNPSLWGTGSLYDRFEDFMREESLILESDSISDYIQSHVPITEDSSGELIYSPDTEFMNNLYNFAIQYIEENTPWYLLKTVPYSELWAQPFATQSEYDSVQNFLKSLSADSVVYIKHPYKTNESGYGDDGSGPYVLFYEFVNTDSFVYYSGSMDLEDYAGMYEVLAYDSDWNLKTDYLSIYNIISHNTTASTHYNLRSHRVQGNGMKNSNYNVVNLFTENGREIRVYKTLDDMKSYSVGQRPYYVTEKFVNYDSTVDNSTTITQTEIDNSVTYGDVYNYITNNYDNPNGLSEDELRAILAEYLSQINNNNSGGSSGDSGGSGGGLGGFLDGLGSIGNAIMAILGKLMEILGSAIELVTGAITDLITIIPNSIGDLLGALFPVFPEEWIKAITLSLVLGVVVGIVRMFK